MMRLADAIDIAPCARIPTWFGVGGGAERLAKPRTMDELAACLRDDPHARILGQGANLLVADETIDDLVVTLGQGAFVSTSIDAQTGLVTAGGGADLAKLIHATVRAGLTGIEGLVGVPASLGGAVRMNAGGRSGEIGSAVRTVEVIRQDGSRERLSREAIGFGYRQSGLGCAIVAGVELQLTPGDPTAARDRLKAVMAGKAASQPLAAKTCGCVFRNPTLSEGIEGIGVAGERVGAGLLIDRAGGKSLALPTCRVSRTHANFIETGPDASAGDILRLIDRVRALVQARFAVTLETEVVVWRRGRARL
ncbi:MAG: UDP-N-acetylmuramate dehydrogenase [Planctomycetota bacterium]